MFLTSRAVHTHFDFWKRIKYDGRGVEPGGNRLPDRRTTNEDVAFRVLWGWRQDCVKRGIQPELARLGFTVSARTVAKYMNSRQSRGPSSGCRNFLKRHESSIWACDFFCVQTILFQTLYVFFVIRYVNREIPHVAVTTHPTAEWAIQQIVECCAGDGWPPRFLIHDQNTDILLSIRILRRRSTIASTPARE